MRRGVPKPVGATSACTSTRSVRVPESAAVTALPAASCGRSARKRADGFATSARPRAFISKTPISLAEPKRFLWARSTRYGWAPPPSK